MFCALEVVMVFLRQVSQCFPSLKVVKILASLLIEFLKESSGDQVTLNSSTNPVLAGGVVVMAPFELTNSIVFRFLTKET